MIKTYHAAKDFDPYLFVKFGDDAKQVTPGAAGTDNLIGVSTNIPAKKDVECDVIWQGEAELKLGGTVKGGDRLTSDANGKGVKAETGNITKAIAADDGVAGDIIRVCVV